MKKIILFTGLLLGGAALAQNVNIPDANFKAYLVGNTSINTNADSEIQVSEAQAFTGYIFCNGLGISDLTGIEAFVNLDSLACESNSIATLDVSQNTGLKYLRCGANQLTALDVSSNTSLTFLQCSVNQISSLDVSANTALVFLNCWSNNISSLDLSQNTALEDINCSGNDLTTLDLSVHGQLTSIQCRDNQLSSLYVSNGNNTNVTFFWADQNPNLTCIEVDDAAYSTANWTLIDAGTSFDEDCCYLNTNVLVNGITLSAELNTMAYQWIDCDNGNQPIAGATSQSYTPTTNGNYACIVDNLICSDTSECIAVTTVGIKEIESKLISVYPNPANDRLNIEGDILSAELYDLSGKLVQSEQTNSFSVENLKRGMYLIKIETPDGLRRAQFIKQ